MSTPPGIKQIKPHVYLGTALVMIVALWVWWLVENYAGIRISRRFSTRSEPINHWIPLIGTPIVFIGSIFWWRRAAGIVANGVLVDAKILSFGSSNEGMQDATLYYTVDGKVYTLRKSFDKSDLGDRRPGDFIQIVADKRKPKRIIINN